MEFWWKVVAPASRLEGTRFSGRVHHQALPACCGAD
jgi:hypothetical protein